MLPSTRFCSGIQFLGTALLFIVFCLVIGTRANGQSNNTSFSELSRLNGGTKDENLAAENAGSDSSFALDNDEVSESGGLSASRVHSINERITLLKKLLDDEKEFAANQLAIERANVKRIKARENLVVNSQLKPPEADTALPDTGDLENTSSKTYVPTIPVSTNELAVGSGTPVFTGPVDSLELGNSLFKTGNYKASLKSYQAKLSEAPHSELESWLQCMMGCCFRLERDFPKAEAMFRKIANKEQNDVLAMDYAKWSLGYIEKRRTSMVEFSSIESTLNNILKDMNNEEVK